MKWFLGRLVLQVGLLAITAGVGSEVLIKLEGVEDTAPSANSLRTCKTIFCLAKATINVNGNCFLDISIAQTVRVNKDGIEYIDSVEIDTALEAMQSQTYEYNPKVSWERVIRFQCLSVDTPKSDKLIHMETNKHWFTGTLQLRKKDIKNNNLVNPVLIEFRDKIRLEIKNYCFDGYMTGDSLLMMSLTNEGLQNFKELFTEEIWLSAKRTYSIQTPILNPTRTEYRTLDVMVELHDMPIETFGTGYTFVFMKYWSVEKRPSVTEFLGLTKDCRTYISSKCYLQYSENGKYYHAIGQIKYFKREAVVHIWFQRLIGGDQKVLSTSDLNMVDCFSIAKRQRDGSEIHESPANKRWINVYIGVHSSVKQNTITNHITINRSFGIPKILRSESVTIEPVFFDERNKLLTIMGKHLKAFEDHRNAVFRTKNVINKKQFLEVELLDIENESKAKRKIPAAPVQCVPVKINIQYSVEAILNNTNAFGFPIHQYEYI